ncbi:hypothetical protein [Bacterioplanoides sp.]|uniref:hypothetical protein n=1 Tax=Bacterioplanoides sp. TaxID=2066072 RepID=UPI003AFFC58D
MSIHPFVLLITAAVLLWQNRLLASSDNEQELNERGQGDCAALLASSLIFMIAAALAVVGNALPELASDKDFDQFSGLFEQLALFAALPLMVINGFTRVLGFDWDRTIWGRILLAICAVFALTRTSELLDYWLMLILVLGAITFVLPIARYRSFAFIAPLAFWLMLVVGYSGLELRSTGTSDQQHWSWLGLTLIPYLICSNRWLSFSRPS